MISVSSSEWMPSAVNSVLVVISSPPGSACALILAMMSVASWSAIRSLPQFRRFPTPIDQRPFVLGFKSPSPSNPRQALHDRSKVAPSIETETLSSNKRISSTKPPRVLNVGGDGYDRNMARSRLFRPSASRRGAACVRRQSTAARGLRRLYQDGAAKIRMPAVCGRSAGSRADQHRRRPDRRRPPRLGDRCRRRRFRRRSPPRPAKRSTAPHPAMPRCSVKLSRRRQAAASPGCRRKPSSSTVRPLPARSTSILPTAPRR